MPGIAEVARLAGVSQATASRALTGRGYVSAETKARVEEVAGSLGYVASSSASSLVTGRTQNIGVVMPAPGRWFFAEALEGIQSALLERRYDLSLYDAKPGSPARAAIFNDFLARKRFDGIIAAGIEPDHRELEQLLAFGKPVVSIGGYDGGTSAVSIHDEEVARRATEHLLELGHQRIVFLGGDPDGRKTSFGDQQRVHGYLETMAAAGLSAEARHVPSAVSMPGGYSAAADLLGDSRTRPTALVAVCDEVAVGAIIAARRMGIQVPADLSVIGIDDHEYAEMFALTTLKQSPRDQGIAAVEMLMRQIADPDTPPQRVYEPSKLIMRSSTAPIDLEHSAIANGVAPRSTT